MSDVPRIELIAHRGNARDYPENTLPAFRSALELGLRCLELDVHLCADGTPVVIHDHRLARTTGLAGSIFDLTATQAAATEAAEVARLGERHRGTHLPLLSDVLVLLEGRPDVTLFVEIKRQSLRRFGHDAVVGRVLQALQPWRDQCVVISFDLQAVEQARARGGFTIGWVLGDYGARSAAQYQALQPEFLFCDHEQLPPAGSLPPGPWHWAIYEVETLPLALQLAERGVTHIETMAVREMSAALRRVGAIS